MSNLRASDHHSSFVFEQTHTHKGLQNEAGHNNCFLNVTIQALWHLGPFRANLKQLIGALESGRVFSANLVEKSFILALCNLFIQYEFTDEQVLPPDELRSLLGSLDEKFGLGKIADANEALDAILQKIHGEFSTLCPSQCKCLAHQTFGGQVLEQFICGLCGASSEPRISDSFMMYFQVMELLSEAAKSEHVTTSTSSVTKRSFKPISNMLQFTSNQFRKNSIRDDPQETHSLRIKNRLFGRLLQNCMVSLGQHSCPSVDEPSMQGRFKCSGKATLHTMCLEAPLSLALSFGWTETRECGDIIQSFLSLIPSNVYLHDIFRGPENWAAEEGMPTQWRSNGYMSFPMESTGGDNIPSALIKPPTGPSYALQGMVCYYGLHYVSIFFDHSEDNLFLLFDDQRVRPIGDWSDVISLCVRSLYQPVLLLYELEQGTVASTGADSNEQHMNQNLVLNYCQILGNISRKPVEQEQQEIETKTCSDSPARLAAAIAASSSVEVHSSTSMTANLHAATTRELGLRDGDVKWSPNPVAIRDDRTDSLSRSYSQTKGLQSPGVPPSNMATNASDSDWQVVNRMEAASMDQIELTSDAIADMSIRSQSDATAEPKPPLKPSRELLDIRRRLNLADPMPAFGSPRISGRLSAKDQQQLQLQRFTPPHSPSSKPAGQEASFTFERALKEEGKERREFSSVLQDQRIALSQFNAAAKSASSPSSSERYNSSGMSSRTAEVQSKRSNAVLPIISHWGVKPLRYSCTIPVVRVQGLVFLGVTVQRDESSGQLLVTSFQPLPGSYDKPSELERKGMVKLMDVVLKVNGVSVKNLSEQDFEDLVGNIAAADSRLQLEFLSQYSFTTFFLCPLCYTQCQLEALQESELKDVFTRMDTHYHYTIGAHAKEVVLRCKSCYEKVRAIDFKPPRVSEHQWV